MAPSVDTRFPHFPTTLPSQPVKRDADLISAAEREVLHEAKARLQDAPRDRIVLVRDALERKKAAALLLASAQRDLETHTPFMIEDEGLEETIRFHKTHYDIGDPHTPVGRFIKAISSISFKTCSAVGGQFTPEGPSLESGPRFVNRDL
ncbi:hypothetical protein EV363DRAFT_1426127 [Boletus edulis]|nr:hypothetical protein EV363DRAFT_1426127 [Boletus edulis]